MFIEQTQCLDWCKEQYFHNDYQNLILLLWSLIGFIAYFLSLLALNVYVPKENDSLNDAKKKQLITKITYAFNQASLVFSFFMQIAFLIMWRISSG